MDDVRPTVRNRNSTIKRQMNPADFRSIKTAVCIVHDVFLSNALPHACCGWMNDLWDFQTLRSLRYAEPVLGLSFKFAESHGFRISSDRLVVRRLPYGRDYIVLSSILQQGRMPNILRFLHSLCRVALVDKFTLPYISSSHFRYIYRKPEAGLMVQFTLEYTCTDNVV